jgi:hypothetical protein
MTAGRLHSSAVNLDDIVFPSASVMYATAKASVDPVPWNVGTDHRSPCDRANTPQSLIIASIITMSVVKAVCMAMERVAPLRLAAKWDNVCQFPRTFGTELAHSIDPTRLDYC